METINFQILINAPRERVWKVLWEDASYRAWVAVFHEGSYAESDWQEGSRIYFLGPDRSGMASRIAKLVENDTMIFEHLGEMRQGVEDLTTEWAGAAEKYFLRATPEGNTELSVELDTGGEFVDYFQKTFPLALAKVKELAEA